MIRNLLWAAVGVGIALFVLYMLTRGGKALPAPFSGVASTIEKYTQPH